MARVDLQTLEEARNRVIELETSLSDMTVSRDAAVAQASEKDGIIAGHEASITKLREQNHALFLRIPMVDKTEEPEPEDEPQSLEDFAHSISDEF